MKQKENKLLVLAIGFDKVTTLAKKKENIRRETETSDGNCFGLSSLLLESGRKRS